MTANVARGGLLHQPQARAAVMRKMGIAVFGLKPNTSKPSIHRRASALEDLSRFFGSPAHLVLHRHLLRAGFDAEEQNIVVRVLKLGSAKGAVAAIVGAGGDAVAHDALAIVIRSLRGRA